MIRWGKTKIVALVAVLLIAGTSLWWWQRVRTQRLAELRDAVIAAFAAGDWDEAARLSGDWTDAQPESGEAWVRHANALSMTGEHEQALAALERVPPTFERLTEVKETRLNLLLRDLHRPFECRSACERLLEDEPRNETALGLLIYIDAMLLDIPQLSENLRRALAASVETPDHYVYLMMLDNFALINGDAVTAQWLEEAPENVVLQAAHAVHTQDRLRLLQVKEASAENRAQLAAAIARVEELATDSPQDARLLRSRVLTALADGKVDVLRQLLTIASETSQAEAVCLRARAFVHLADGDTDAADSCIQQALQQHPLSFECRAMHSDILRRQGRRDAASALQTLAMTGTKIRETISAMTSVTDATPGLLRRIANYARECEDWETAAALERRLPLAGASGP